MTDREMRELDAWAAEYVMEWRRVSSLRDFCSDSFIVNTSADCLAWNWENRTWKPTTDPAAAMKVLKKCGEKMKRSRDGLYDLVCVRPKTTSDGWTVFKQSQEDGGYLYAESETLELAICLFANKLFSK